MRFLTICMNFLKNPSSQNLFELPRRVDDGDSQTKKNIFFGNFYCTVVPTISNPLLRILIAALRSRS